MSSHISYSDHVSNWANDILKLEGLGEWSIKGSNGGPSSCLHSSKTILIEPCSREWRVKEIILHEIAHAMDGPRGPHTSDEAAHGGGFYRHFIQLVDDHLYAAKGKP